MEFYPGVNPCSSLWNPTFTSIILLGSGVAMANALSSSAFLCASSSSILDSKLLSIIGASGLDVFWPYCSDGPCRRCSTGCCVLSKGTLAIQEGLSALEAEGANTTSLKLDNVCKFTEVMARLRLGHGRTQARL